MRVHSRSRPSGSGEEAISRPSPPAGGGNRCPDLRAADCSVGLGVGDAHRLKWPGRHGGADILNLLKQKRVCKKCGAGGELAGRIFLFIDKAEEMEALPSLNGAADRCPLIKDPGNQLALPVATMEVIRQD